MLQRKIMASMIHWKNRSDKKSLIVTGPRQSGKTTIIRRFGQEQYAETAEINFKKTPSAVSIFSGDLDVDTLLLGMQFQFPGISFIPGKTLIFLDEIQECPEAITSLKFWTEDGRFDVVCSGSLLGIDYKRASSYPVGYVDFLFMHAMDFEEYLTAMNISSGMIGQIRKLFDEGKAVPEAVNTELFRHYRAYNAVGGMPEAVQRFVDTKDWREVHAIQDNLLQGYRYDIAHYAESSVKVKAEKCYFSLSKQLLEKENHKFQYGIVEKGTSARKYESSTEWLEAADIVTRSIQVTAVKAFPEDYEIENSFRLYTTDIGMLTGMREFSFKETILNNTLTENTKGGFWEAAVADALNKNGYRLHFYKNDSSKREVEFIIVKNGSVIPVEVKGGKASSKSLSGLMKNNPDIPYAYKLTDGNVGISENRIITVPLYMSCFI